MLTGDDVDVLLTEVGGTVGDIEILPFLEAIRQFRLDVGDDNVCYVHVTLVPYIGPSGEHKTKPTQHSVTELRAAGIQPHAIVCRSDEPISDDLERKISRLSNVPFDGVVNAPDADSLYEIPLIIHDEGLDVSWTPVHGGGAAMNAVLDGSVDVGYGGLGPVIRLRSEGAPLRVVISMARGLAQNLLVRSRITDPGELRGASWGLDGLGALSHHMARLTIAALGMAFLKMSRAYPCSRTAKQ